MDLHPVIVHFPIALLTLYAGMELVPLKQQWWRPAKAMLAVLGVLASFLALFTGDEAEHNVTRELRSLVHAHQAAAVTSTIIFGIIALVYLMHFFVKDHRAQKISAYILGWPVKVLAILGLLAILATGALGGAIVYGPDADPVVAFFAGLVG